MDIEEFRKNAHQMVDWVCDYYANVEKFPVKSQVSPGEIFSKLPLHPPQGEFLSASLGVQGMLWVTSPACTELEMVVMDWLGRAVGLPSQFLHHESEGKGGGVIQGTASEASLVALVAARDRKLSQEKLTLQEAGHRLTVYSSDQAHSSIKKACMIAGIPLENFRLIPSHPSKGLAVGSLWEQMEKDKKDNLIPFFVCATLGSTSSTAFDSLSEIGTQCEKMSAWLHVDAAYAGSAFICPEYRSLLTGIEKVTSFNFNPHKWLQTNFDCSALWVSDKVSLIKALSVTPVYLQNKASGMKGVEDFRDWQIPLGRRFRALKLWFVMRTFGVKQLQQQIRNHVELAKKFERWVEEDERFELFGERMMALVCFRLKASNELNDQLKEKLNDSGKLYLIHSQWEDTYFLRLSVNSTTTTEEHLAQAWAFIRSTAEELLQQQK